MLIIHSQSRKPLARKDQLSVFIDGQLKMAVPLKLPSISEVCLFVCLFVCLLPFKPTERILLFIPYFLYLAPSLYLAPPPPLLISPHSIPTKKNKPPLSIYPPPFCYCPQLTKSLLMPTTMKTLICERFMFILYVTLNN